MARIVSAGHICLDITPVFHPGQTHDRLADLLIPGKLIQVGAASVYAGGSVGNTGLALKHLGNDVVLLGKVGDDLLGATLTRVLADSGAGGLIVDADSSTSYSVVLAVPGIDRVFLHNPGANDTFEPSDIPERALDGAALFHFGYPTLMKRMYEDCGAPLSRMLRAVKARGVATSLDMTAVDPTSEAGRADWRAILSKALPETDFFVPSFEELCFMLDRPLYDRLSAAGGDMTAHLSLEACAAPLAKACLDMGCAAVLLKCGLSGMYFASGAPERLRRVGANLHIDAEAWSNRRVIQPCFQARIVRSAAGAGDVSIAAFLTALSSGEAPEMCVKLAAAEGAAAVASYDTLGGILPLNELKHQIEAGWKLMEG